MKIVSRPSATRCVLVNMYNVSFASTTPAMIPTSNCMTMVENTFEEYLADFQTESSVLQESS